MAGQVLHGGAHRLEVRWPNTAEPSYRISHYEVPVGEQCTPHVHTGKQETWLIAAGNGTVRIGSESFAVSAGDALVTPPGTPHALVNTGTTPLFFFNLVTITGEAPVTTTELTE